MPHDAAFVSERFSVWFGVEGGGSVELPTLSGTAEFRVAGFYCDDVGNQAVVMMDTATYQQLYSEADLTRQSPVRGQSLGRAGYGGWLRHAGCPSRTRPVSGKGRGPLLASTEFLDG
jgi:hypothetical protein